MANDILWVIHWTYSEYGGPKTYQGSSYHQTLEEAKAYKDQREGSYSERADRFYKDGYEYLGTEPTPEVVSKAKFKKVSG